MFGLYTDAVSPHEIQRLSEQLAAFAEEGPVDALVVTCGDWTLADLTWHLTEVQDFWAFIINNRPDGPGSYVQPQRPADDGLADGLRAATSTLVKGLSACDPETPAWSWHPTDQSVGFSIRRQTHEALIHCADGAVAVGADLPAAAPQLAADGIDEMIDVMLCAVPDWAELSRTGGIVELRTTDTADTWTVAFGRIRGDQPDGTHIDTTCHERADGESADLTISGAALDLDLWLWGRPAVGPISFDGPENLADQLRSPID